MVKKKFVRMISEHGIGQRRLNQRVAEDRYVHVSWEPYLTGLFSHVTQSFELLWNCLHDHRYFYSESLRRLSLREYLIVKIQRISADCAVFSVEAHNRGLPINLEESGKPS